MQLPRRLVQAVQSCRKTATPSQSNTDAEATRARCRHWCELKQLRRCLLWTVQACVLLLFCLGLVVLVEFVVVHPRPPECEVVSLSLTQFSASNLPNSHTLRPTGRIAAATTNTNFSDFNDRSKETSSVQLLTAVIVVVIRASNEIARIGTFYDHVHVRVLYNGDMVGEGLVGPFFQARKISSLLQTQVEAHKMPVRKATAKQLLMDMNDHVVDLQVRVHVLTRVSLLKYFSHHFRVHVWCNITVTIANGSNLSSASTLVSKLCRRKD